MEQRHIHDLLGMHSDMAMSMQTELNPQNNDLESFISLPLTDSSFT